MKRAKGITLIALVITIVVLIILAGVVINLGLGDNGIFKKAGDAKYKYTQQEIKEKISIIIDEIQIEKQGNATLNDLDGLTYGVLCVIPSFENEIRRKSIHDSILLEYGLTDDEQFEW